MLMQMNSTAVSSISTTINGEAFVLEAGTDEEKWCKEQHLMNNTFGSDEQSASGTFGISPSLQRTTSLGEGDGGRGRYIEDETVRVVVVKIRDGRISDWKGEVKDWRIEAGATHGNNMPNGI
jgi:hypothetical protein